MQENNFKLFARDALGISDYEGVDMFDKAISPEKEALSYEKLYSIPNMSFKRIGTLLKDAYPSRIWEERYIDNNEKIEEKVNKVFQKVYEESKSIISIKNCSQFPTKSINKYMDYPVPILYSKGDVGMLDMVDRECKKNICISVVGTRKITEEGHRRTKKLVDLLKKYFDEKLTIVSGLAMGVDTVALSTAVDLSIKVVGVIGTPINKYYPKENIELQDRIAKEHLLISHVPFYRYATEPFEAQKFHFTERNSIMSAISDATIIVEASETSGTRTQARDCLRHGKPLFFLKSCYDSGHAWIENAVKEGARILENMDDLSWFIGKDQKIQ